MVAGPNGSGKTTLTRQLRDGGVDLGTYINPDDIALSLEGDAETVSREAQRLADEQRAACLEARQSFSFETVMSHPSKVELLRAARRQGYFNLLFFVGLEDPRINVARVAQRVALGGHDVPAERIVARYGRTMALLPSAVRTCHRCVLFDNSQPDPEGGAQFQAVCEIVKVGRRLEYRVKGRRMRPIDIPLLPKWLTKALDITSAKLAAQGSGHTH